MTQSSVSAMQDNKTMSRQRKSLSRQQTYAVVRNSGAPKENYVAIEDEEERTEDYRDNIFYVATFRTYVVI